jgi:AbrB family looped-hinge helix DNA binding protein
MSSNLMSQALVKLQRKGQMVIPRLLRDEAGVAEGTFLKVAVVEGGRILLTPQFTIDRSIVAGRPKGNRKKVLQELAQTMATLQGEAKQKGLDKMSTRQINAAVTAVRRERQSTKKPPK